MSASTQDAQRRSVDAAPAAEARSLEEQRAVEQQRERVKGALLAALSNPNASGLSLPTAGAPFVAGFWSEQTGQFVSFGLEQSSVRFSGANAASAAQGEWPLGFDQLPRRVVAREFPDGVVVAAAAVTIDAKPRTAVACLQWMPSNGGGLELRPIGHTVIGALRLASGESVDAAQIHDFEVADWDPRTRQGLLLAPLWGTGEVVSFSVPFDGRAPRSREAMAPLAVLRGRPEEELAATRIGRGRDARAAQHGGRLVVALRTGDAPSGGMIGSAHLPLALHVRDESGAWGPLLTSGPAPQVGADYALWADGESLRAATLASSTTGSVGPRALLAHRLELDGFGAPRWSADVVRQELGADSPEVVHRLTARAVSGRTEVALVDAAGLLRGILLNR